MMRPTCPTAVLLASLLSLLPLGSEARPRIMIDAGHGGTNQGAPGPLIQRYEKQLTLALARRTARYLRLGLPGVEVLMTRQRDRYLTLAQRVRMANRARVDLFVSLHLNATESHSQRGFETFFLSREASAAEAQAATSTAASSQASTVVKILADLRRVAAHGESAQLARVIQRALERVRGRALNRGVRQAPFDVLIGLTMPGVLVEAGFIDHPLESKQMADPGVQEAISAAVAAGVIEHQLGKQAQIKLSTR
jgi:N-acetylmuramoyl-L-alanine amidase